jgi:hypothetical protein
MAQDDKATAILLASGKGHVVPLIPARLIEEQVAYRGHKCWVLPKINLLVPTSIGMWKLWTFISNDEVKTLKRNVINMIVMLRDAQDISHSCPLSYFDHQKCSTPKTRFLTKQGLNIGYGRSNKYLSSFWNIQLPYLRCLCHSEAPQGCQGNIMWFDHAV